MNIKASDLKNIVREVVRECVTEAQIKGNPFAQKGPGGKPPEGDPAKNPFSNKPAHGEYARLNPNVVQGTQPKKLSGPPVKEAGAISEDPIGGCEAEESEETHLIKTLDLTVKRLLAIHGKGEETQETPFEKEEDGEESGSEESGEMDRNSDIAAITADDEDEGENSEEGGEERLDEAKKSKKKNKKGKIDKKKLLKKKFKKGLEEVKKICEFYIAENNGGPQYKVVSANQVDVTDEDKAREIQRDPKVNEEAEVQHRSFRTVKDVPQDPKNQRDGTVPRP